MFQLLIANLCRIGQNRQFQSHSYQKLNCDEEFHSDDVDSQTPH